ncbi:MAG: hypothetical protein WBA86_09270 [Nodosilinea sp.]
MLQDFQFGNQPIQPQQRYPHPEVDYMTDLETWQQINNGDIDPTGTDIIDGTCYITTMRDEGPWVHIDFPLVGAVIDYHAAELRIYPENSSSFRPTIQQAASWTNPKHDWADSAQRMFTTSTGAMRCQSSSGIRQIAGNVGLIEDEDAIT